MKAPLKGAYTYSECLKQIRNDLVAALDERYALIARIDGSGENIFRLHGRLRVQPSPDSISQLRKFTGVPAVIKEHNALQASLSASDTKIAQLQAWIREIYVEHREVPDDEDLKDTICIALRSAGRELTIPVIVRTIQQLQFPIHQQQDPLREVFNTVQTLMIEGKIIVGKPWGAADI